MEPMLLDAVGFAALPPAEMRYSHVLLKELVHHIPEQVGGRMGVWLRGRGLGC